jgi:hypothetical protein
MVTNQVEKMPCGIQWPMALEPRSKAYKQLYFHLFWDATKNG